MKKIISLLLSFVMLACIATTESITAFAGGWMDNVKEITFDTTYTESMSTDDYCTNHRDGYYIDAFKFYVPVDGTVVFNFRTECKDYVWKYTGVQENRPTILEMFSSSDLNNPIVSEYMSRDFNSATGEYYDSVELYLNKGTYYMTMNYKAWVYYYNDGAYYGSYNFELNYSPNISKPSSFKVSTRNTTSLKLSWSKVGGVSGYQLQQKSGDTWKTKVTTSSTSATLSKLTAGKSYSFRARAYKTINGTKYYSSWKTLTTCTKPAKVTLSKLTAYSSGHKIKASWKKVSGYAGGYQIYWAKDKSFKKVVAKTTVSGQSKTSYTGKNFTKGKKYYVKVRAYKVVNGTKYYGSWSNVKSITCK